MGRDKEHWQVQGRIFVLQTKGTPIAVAKPEDRAIIHDGYKRVSVELWRIGRQIGGGGGGGVST